MDRRAFLRAMIAAGVGTTLDPEQLLWVPRQMVTVPAMPYKVLSMDILLQEYKRLYADVAMSHLQDDSFLYKSLALEKEERSRQSFEVEDRLVEPWKGLTRRARGHAL